MTKIESNVHIVVAISYSSLWAEHAVGAATVHVFDGSPPNRHSLEVLITKLWSGASITSDVAAPSRTYDSCGPIARQQGCDAGTRVTIYPSGENEGETTPFRVPRTAEGR